MNTRELFDLKGKVALVTGGSRGLGLQIATGLGEMGCKVAITARKADELAEASKELTSKGIENFTVANDLSKLDQIPAMVDQVVKHFGTIDILVNNAGATWGAKAEEYPDDAWRKVMTLNIDAMFHLSREVGKRCLIPNKGGKIINIASIAGLRGGPSDMHTIAYNTSKGAAVNFTRALASEWGPHGINVNAVCPGFFPTKMANGILERIGERVIKGTPLRRLGGDEDLKGVVVFLASNAARHITGQCIAVDGGPELLVTFEKFTGTRPVVPALAFDAERLAVWMRANVDESTAALSVSQFKGGQSNPTYLIGSGVRRYALRRKPPGKLLPSAHAVEREYRVMTALAGTDVPVPKTYVLCEDPEVIGTAFFLADYVEGRVLWDPTLPDLTPEQRSAHYIELNRVIAALHKVDYQAVGLADYGKPGNYLARQIDRWTRQYRASETETINAMDNLIDWLPENIPPGEETAIVHGDYRIDNVIFHPSEPRILAVLDWELSTLGHPLADFAYHCMTWRMPEGAHGRGLAGVDLASLGIPAEREYIARYCRLTGRESIPHFEYYLAYNMFRLAAILQGVKARALQGNAASAEALTAGSRTRAIADEGWKQAERILARN